MVKMGIEERLDRFLPTTRCFKLFESRDVLLLSLDQVAREAGMPIMVIGGAALARYGYNRVTDDVDLVLSADDAYKLGDLLIKSGQFECIGHSKCRHASGMDVNICPTGVIAGSQRFPKPEQDVPGIHYVSLPRLLAMKIQAKRLKDRGDYGELVKRNRLVLDYIRANVHPLLNPIDRQWAENLWHEAQKEL
jgi:hypothetical protein